MSATSLKIIPTSWQFFIWELDMMGALRKVSGGMTLLLVAIDKFTKWIEAKPIRKFDIETIIDFMKDIIFLLRNPNKIITDRGADISQGAFS